MLIKDQDGNYIIAPRRPGYEAVPLTGVVGIDLSGDGNTLGLDAPLEYGFGGSVVVAAYAGIMEALELVPAYRAGLITKRELGQQALAAAWKETKNKAAYVIVCAVVVSLLPGTGPLFAVAGLLGAGVMSWRLVRQFADALSDEQLNAIKKAASDVDVKIPGLTDKETSPATGTAAGYDEVDPLPNPA